LQKKNSAVGCSCLMKICSGLKWKIDRITDLNNGTAILDGNIDTTQQWISLDAVRTASNLQRA